MNLEVFAGTGEPGASGDAGPALLAQLSGPAGMAVNSNGEVLVADSGSNRIRAIAPDGTIRTIAGDGTRGNSGDQGLATRAQLNAPNDVAVSENDIFIADTLNHRIRRIDSAGVLSTIAGAATRGYSGDGGPSSVAALFQPTSVAVTASGTLYIADAGNSVIRSVAPDGTIATAIGSGQGGTQTFVRPVAIAIGVSGDLYVADVFANAVYEYDLSTPAPTLRNTFAAAAPSDLVTAPDGGVLVLQAPANAPASIIAIAPNGALRSLAIGSISDSDSASIHAPDGLGLLPDGDILIADFGGNRVFRAHVR
jgi:hypothetical protein